MGAAYLPGYIAEYNAIFFEPLIQNAFGNDDTLTRVYAQDLKFQIAEVEQEITEVNQRLADVRQYQGGSSIGANSSTRDTAQLDGSALKAVVDLAEQAALASYLQASLDLRYELTQRLARLNTRLARINSDASASVGDDFIALATERYNAITQNYEDILNKAQALVDANPPAFYFVITQPDTEGSLVAKRDLLFIALALALGGMLAVIAALVWPQRQS